MKKTKKQRIPIPIELSDEVLKLSDRTCCVCREKGKDVQIHHIDENPSNNSIENLAVLCFQCHNETQVTGGFGKKLTSGQVIKYKNEWLKIVKDRNDNLAKGIQSLDKQQCWDNINFDNQQGIEGAILGVGLNQNYVEACPKLNIFQDAINCLELLNYVNIIGESGSGKSLTAFQIAYEYSKKGYKVYKYNGKDNPTLYSELSPAIYILDNAHLYKNVANTIQQQAKKECKVICVFTDVINSNENSVRITSKQSVNILYEYYTQNAEQIIPIVKKINKKVGFNFGDTSFSWLINKAASQKSPYYFNYIIRGASDYIKTKMEDYKKDEYLDLLAVIAIYQILSADNFILISKLNELIPSKIFNYDEFEKKLIIQDKFIIKENESYKFSHIYTAISFLNSYILSSFDNQDFANKCFLTLIDNNTFCNLGLLWFIVNSPHEISIKYKTNRVYYSLFTKEEIDKIYDKVFEKRNEPYFFSVIERISYYHKIVHDDSTRKALLSVINSCVGEDFICVGDFINMLINEAGRKNYEILDYYLKGIDFKRIFELFNGSSTKDLYVFIRFFDRILYRSKYIGITFTQHLDVEKFILKINNSNLDNLYVLSYLSAIFINENNGLKNIENAIIEKTCSLLNLNPLKVWVNLDDFFLFTILGYNKYEQRFIRKKQYTDIKSKFINSISLSKLSQEIENNYIFHWQSISEFMRIIYLLDKNKCKEIIKNVNINKLSNTIKLLWNTENEFESLMAFSYDSKFLFDLIKISENHINKISLNLCYWCPHGAIYLSNKGKSLSENEFRNDYVMTNAIINMIQINKPFALRMLSKEKDNIVKYIKSEFCYGDINGEQEKLNFYNSLKSIEDEILKLDMTDEEKGILLNYDNYNLTHPEKNIKTKF